METCILGKNESIFMENTSQASYPILNNDIEADIAIVGGGIVGLTLAYLLRDLKQKVVLLEADHIAMGTSLRTTAKLTPCHNLIYSKLIYNKGIEIAKQYAKANIEAMNFVKDTIQSEHIECELTKSPCYVYTINQENVQKIVDEVEACKQLSVPVVYKECLPVRLPIKAALGWEESYVFHIRKYLLRLAELFTQSGGEIYEKSPVQVIAPDDTNTLETVNGSHIYAKKVVIASHYPMYDGLGLYFTRLQMKRDYVIGVRVAQDKIPEGNYISVDNPKFSIRPVPEKNVVLIGGGEHRTGDDMEEYAHFNQLRELAKEAFDTNEVVCHWSTQDYVTSDSIPYIGYLNARMSHSLYVATGFNKWGMTGGTNAALLLKDMLTIGISKYEEVFNPIRGGAFKGKTFIEHNVQGIKCYIQGKLHQVPIEKFPEKGQATVARLEDGNVYGIYQDEEEHYHIVDIICPHVGATLRWNSAEKSWDCPFHGSRFSIDGEVLEGPSTHKLNSYQEKKNHIHPNLY